MKRHDANRQLCKMQGEVADRLGLKTICTCGDTAEWVGEVPDEVISELWTLIADGYLFRHLREIISKERPKGRRLNIEELEEKHERSANEGAVPILRKQGRDSSDDPE